MKIDLLVADIITNELQINASRVVVYGGNYKAPKDGNLYVIISTRNSRVLGNTNKFDDNTLEEVKSTNIFANLEIELTSKNRDAYERKEEVIMALTSTYSIQQQEKNNFKIFRNGDILDLTFIEGTSSLYRFVIPITINYLKIKRTSVEYFDKQREVEINVEGR